MARVLTEEWCAREMFCPSCENNHIAQSRVNTPAIDFVCGFCDEQFQLKGQRKWNASRLVDGAYESLIRALKSDRNPNLIILQYSESWNVENLCIIPRTFFSPSVVECRKPLALDARRAGWTGCNIMLGKIPADGKISVIEAGRVIHPDQVRSKFSRALQLANIAPANRGWTLDVLALVRSLRKETFSLKDMYKSEEVLKTQYPGNRHIREKIRQQLQVLRNHGFLEFLGSGNYRVSKF